MKKLTKYIVAGFLLLTIVPTQLIAGSETRTSSPVEAKQVETKEASALTSRLVAIKEMDKSKMSASEKKGLRKEVRSIKSRLKELQGGIYLSVGAVILIVILLIILL